MCKTNKRFFLYLLFVLLAAALRAEEPDRWYLISETEMRSIEQYKMKSEQEKQSWLLQARALKQDSANSNAQLAQAREQNRRLEKSYNKSEADRLMQLSLKNGEIADLKQKLADKTLDAEKGKSKAARMLAVIIALTAIIAGLIVIRMKRII